MIGTIETILENAMNAVSPSTLSQFASDARQIEQFRNLDFSSMDAEMSGLFANASGMRLRHFGLTHRACNDLAVQYIRRVHLTYSGASEAETKAFGEVRKKHSFDMQTLEAEKRCVGQQSYLFACVLTADGRDLRPMTFGAHEIDCIEFADPFETDLRKAARIVLSVPVSDPWTVLRTATPALAIKLIFTPTEAVMRYPGGQVRGLLAADGSNPLGYIPVCGTRRAMPVERTQWLPHIAEDLRSCQIGAILGVSDMEFTARHQSHGRTVLTGEAAALAATTIPSSPDAVWPLPPGVTASILQSQPVLEKYQKAIELTIRLVTTYRYLSPDGYTGITGAAKLADSQGLQDERERQELRCREFEQVRCEIVADVHNRLLPRAQRLPEGFDVEVKFHYPRPRDNVLQEMQARMLSFGAGLDSAIEFIEEFEGVSEERAEELFVKRLERHQRALQMMGGGNVPGLDAIAGTIGIDNQVKGALDTHAVDVAEEEGGADRNQGGVPAQLSE